VITQKFNDGSCYEGHVNKKGKRTGQGIMYFYDNPVKAANNEGAVYFGAWLANEMKGMGTYIYENFER
jgi:hypothetical protein